MCYLQPFLLFQCAVNNVAIRMKKATVSVNETVLNGTVDVCVEIAVLPGELQTNLTVTLFTTNGGKAG